MSNADDLAWGTVTPKKCRRHEWVEVVHIGQTISQTECGRCGKRKDAAVSRRSRNNRKRGGSWENEAAKDIGGRRMGQLNLPWDVEAPGYARIQTKVLDRWPSLAKVGEWLDAITPGDELRIVALRDTPGPGKRARRLAVMDWDEFCRWHGRSEEAA